MQNEDREPPISRNGYRLHGLLGRRGGVLRLERDRLTWKHLRFHVMRESPSKLKA